MRKYRAALLAGGLCAGALLAPLPASAVTALTLTQVFNDALGPQSTSNPCVIAGTQCQQPTGFGFNNFVQGNVTAIDAFSSAILETLLNNTEGVSYTVGQIIDALAGATSFNVALDVNAAGAATDTLNLFRVRIGGVLTYEYDPGAPGLAGGTNVATGINNGNGFGDWSLGVIDLSGYSLDTNVIFFAAMTGLTDGAESFFLTAASSPSQVPIPGALLMMAPVLAGGGAVGWWRKRKERRSPSKEATA